MHSGWVLLHQSCVIRSRNDIFSWSQRCVLGVGEVVTTIVSDIETSKDRGHVAGDNSPGTVERVGFGFTMCLPSPLPPKQK